MPTSSPSSPGTRPRSASNASRTSMLWRARADASSPRTDHITTCLITGPTLDSRHRAAKRGAAKLSSAFWKSGGNPVDRWSEIELFVQVAELGSLSRAAEAQGLSNAAASRHLAALEERLCARL